ncbi:LysR family transcriptional regulator [Acinetobacter puyangensis]|uniref:Transcriptional regulator, LysR family n=1 Tax=Acinetobacter puyangensis TaxID=1096779 RepID=A0A240ECK6_9GAMM|nr:LysR family transcriptional regulator [Acinetobacter puyangensis]SNX46448.1 transcriptional regulator, LysR family [Acinetobacter puyangensis]
MRPDLNLLYALDALLEEGSVVGAAHRMNLSPSAMSRILARIRQTTKDPILVPSGRAMVATPRALEIHAQLKQVLHSSTDLLSPAVDVDLKQLSIHFKIRANDAFTSMYAAPLLNLLAQEMPQASLCFTPEEDDLDDEALRSGRIDLLISASRILGHEMRVQALFQTRMVGLVCAQHPILSEEITPQALTEWGHINVSRRGKLHGPVDEALKKWALNRQIKAVFPTFSSALFTLQQSNFILILPKEMADIALQMGMNLQSFQLPFSLSPILMTQSWHPRHQNHVAH